MHAGLRPPFGGYREVKGWREGEERVEYRGREGVKEEAAKVRDGRVRRVVIGRMVVGMK